MVFPVIKYGCESWTEKKAEHWRTDALVLEKTLQSPLDSKEIKPVILKEISTDYSLEGLILKLKLQYFGHLIWRTDSLEKTLIMGKIEGRRRRGWQRMRRLDGITNLMDMSLSKPPEVGDGQGNLACCSPWGWKESDMTERLNWTDWSSETQCEVRSRSFKVIWRIRDLQSLCISFHIYTLPEPHMLLENEKSYKESDRQWSC